MDQASVSSYSTEMSEGEAKRRAHALIRSTQRGISSVAAKVNTRTRRTAAAFTRAEADAKRAAAVGAAGPSNHAAVRRQRREVPAEVAGLDFSATLSELRQRVAESRDETRYDRHAMQLSRDRKGGQARKKGGGDADGVLEFGVGTEGVVPVGEWKYYRFELDEAIETRVVLRAVSGNSDLYVSTATMRPNPQDFTWRSCRNGTDFVVIRPEDPAAIEGTYYVGVYGDCGATSKSPSVLFYLSVTKSKEVTASRRVSTAERLLAKQGYQHNDDGKSKLRNRVAAAQWRRKQMRSTGKDFIRHNKHRARTAKLRERPGKIQARLIQTQRFTRSAGLGRSSSATSLATTPAGRTHTGAFGSSSSSRPGSGVPPSPLRHGSRRGLRRTNTEPIFKLMDSRTVPGTYMGTSHDDRAKFGEAVRDDEETVPATGQERWRALFGMFEPTGSDMVAKVQEKRQKRREKRIRDLADLHSRALDRAEVLNTPSFPSFTSWNLEGASPTRGGASGTGGGGGAPRAAGGRSSSPNPAGAMAATQLSGGQYAFGSRVYRDHDNIVPRRNTPRSLMKAKPPELLAYAAQRRPIAPVEALGFEDQTAAKVGASGADVPSGVELPRLPSPPRTYLDEHRSNRVVVPFRKDIGFTGKDFDPYDTHKPVAGPVSIVSRRPNASLGTAFGVHPVVELADQTSHVRLAPMLFGGTDFTIEMWVNCRSVNARNSRLLEFGSEELPGYSLNEDGDLDDTSVDMDLWAGGFGDPVRRERAAAAAPAVASVADGTDAGSVDGASTAAGSTVAADSGTGDAVASAAGSRRPSAASTVPGKLPHLKLIAAEGSPQGAGGSMPRSPSMNRLRGTSTASPWGGESVTCDEGKDGTCTLRLEGKSGRVTWAVREDGRWYTITTRAPLGQDRWVHVAVVGTKARSVQIFFDGCLEASGEAPVPSRMIRLRHYIGTSTWDDQATPYYGLVFGMRVWRCARSHVQLRATRAADVACEDDSLGLGLSLKESSFVDDMMKLAASQRNPAAEAEMLDAVSSQVGSPKRAGGRTPGGMMSPAAAAAARAGAQPTAIMNPKFATLEAIAELFRVEPKHIKYPLSLDPELLAHYPMTEGAGTLVHNQVMRKHKGSNGVSEVMRLCGVLYGGAWTLSLETKSDRSRVIEVATKFDTLLREFDRLQATTRRAVVRGFLSLAKLHRIPVQSSAPKPPPSRQLADAGRGGKGLHKKPWMKSLRVVRAASGMLSGGSGFLFRDKKETQAWVTVLRDGFYVQKTDPGTPMTPGTGRKSLSGFNSAASGGTSPTGLGGGMMGRIGGLSSPSSRRHKEASEQRRATRLECTGQEAGVWVEESIPALHRSACFFLVTAPESPDEQIRIDIRYRGMSCPAVAGQAGTGTAAGSSESTGTYLDRGSVTVLAGVGPSAPEPRQYLWGVVAGNRRVGDLDSVTSAPRTVADDSSRHIVLSRGAHKNSSSTTLYVAVTSGDVLGEGRDNAPRREEHLRNANLHHEFSIRVTPRLAPAAAAKRVRRFQHHSMASGTSDAAGGDLDSGTAAGGLLAGTGLVDGVVQSPRSKREGAILVGPEFEFVGISQEKMRFDRITLSLRSSMHAHPKLKLNKRGRRRRARQAASHERVSVFRRSASEKGRCNMRCGSHDHHHET